MAAKNSDAVKMAVYFFLVTSSFGFLQPFLPLYMEAVGLSKLEIGIVSGLGSGLALLIQPLLGKLTDKLDTRRPFIFGSALAAFVAYFCLPWIRGFEPILAVVAIGANGTMFLNAVGGVLIGRLAEAQAGGSSYAGIRLWGSVGYIVTSLASGILVLQTGADGLGREALSPVFWGGAWVFFGVAALSLFLPDRKGTRQEVKKEGPTKISPNMAWFLGAYFLYSFALYGSSSFLSLYLKTLGAKGLAITATFAAGVLVEVFVMKWVGRFSDRFGRRPALAISFLLLPVRLLLYMPALGPLWVVAVQSLHGINFGIIGAVAVVFVNDLTADQNRGAAQAKLFAVAGLATAVGPPILGLVADRWSLVGMFGAASAVAAVAAWAFMTQVHDSLPSSSSLAEVLPPWLRPFGRWLDSPKVQKT